MQAWIPDAVSLHILENCGSFKSSVILRDYQDTIVQQKTLTFLYHGTVRTKCRETKHERSWKTRNLNQSLLASSHGSFMFLEIFSGGRQPRSLASECPFQQVIATFYYIRSAFALISTCLIPECLDSIKLVSECRFSLVTPVENRPLPRDLHPDWCSVAMNVYALRSATLTPR